MDWPSVEEMPHDFRQPVPDQRTLDEVISYCKNDVESTTAIFKLSQPLINLRMRLSAKYNIPCLNWSNTKIGSELLLMLYCKKTGMDPKQVRDLRTERAEIHVKDILFPYLQFITPEFKEFFEGLKHTVIRNTKGDFKYSFPFRGSTFEYGTGGIHQCIKPGVYKQNAEYIILDLDVASLYPSIAVVNEMYPEHLGRAFFEVYKNDLVDVRLGEKAKKELGDKAIIEGFKEAANASYGNSNSQYSWLCDSQYTMQTTINGQLLLSMLIEELLIKLTNCQLLQTNTDGATIRLLRSDLELYYDVCSKWEAVTKLQLEFAEYKQMIISDVNSYIGEYSSGKVKCKGRFEWEDLQNHKPTHLHKNKSMLVVAKGIFAYFIKGISPEDFLNQHAKTENFYDFCAGSKLKGAWCFEEVGIGHELPENLRNLSEAEKIDYLHANGWQEGSEPDNWVRPGGCKDEFNTEWLSAAHAFALAAPTEAVITRIQHQKLLRYYISKDGNKIVKRDIVRKPDGTQGNGKRQIQLEAGKWKQITCNQYVAKPFDEYRIDMRYYLEAIRNEIVKIESHAPAVVLNTKAAQLQLF